MSERPYQPLDAFTHPRDHSSRVVPLWVEGRPPYDLAVSEHTLAFGGRLVDTPSEPLVLIVTNTGFKPINITAVTVVGEQFSIAPVPAKELAAGKILAIPVTFRPTEFGVNYGSITITTEEGVAKRVRLIGAGIWDYVNAVDDAIEHLWGFLQRATRPALTSDGAILDLSNTGIEFKDELPIGEQSEIFVFTISNAGNQPLIIDNIAVTGEFELVP